MIRRSIFALTVLTLMVCMASILFARGAPPGKKAFTQAVAVETVTPTVASVAPVMTGYDLIQNLSTETRDLSIAQNRVSVATANRGSRSTTGDERNSNRFGYGFGRSAPCIVMLA